MNAQPKIFKRVVTGHDADGKAIIISNLPPMTTQLIGGPGGPTFFEVWHTAETPALITAQPASNEDSLVLAPPGNGTRIQVINFPRKVTRYETLPGQTPRLNSSPWVTKALRLRRPALLIH